MQEVYIPNRFVIFHMDIFSGSGLCFRGNYLHLPFILLAYFSLQFFITGSLWNGFMSLYHAYCGTNLGNLTVTYKILLLTIYDVGKH